MQASTLSQELLSLFDIVRRQADEYTENFSSFSRKSRELDAVKNNMQRVLLEFSKRSAEELEITKTNSESTITTLQSKLDFVDVVYKELEIIQKFADSLQELKASLYSKHLELDSILKSIHHHVKAETDKVFLKSESKVASQITRIENEQTALAGKVNTSLETYRREINSLGEEINRFKNKVTETKFIVDEATKIVGETILAAEKNFEEKLNTRDLEIDKKVASGLESFLKDSNYQRTVERLGSEVTSISKKVNSKQNNPQSKIMIAIGISAFAVILSVVAIVMK